jgi:hypothetical protein
MTSIFINFEAELFFILMKWNEKNSQQFMILLKITLAFSWAIFYIDEVEWKKITTIYDIIKNQ